LANVPANHWDEVIASYSPNLKKPDHIQTAASQMPNGSTRGYHAASILHYKQKDHLLVLGGIHHRQAVFRMELYDIANNLWSTGIQKIESINFGTHINT
jgi:hypothetical protein